MMQQQVDTAVIGGGLAGLTAAAFLAKAGNKVIVLEKAKQLGGRAQTQQRGEFLFNLGPHALYAGAPGSQILCELDILWSGGEPEVRGTAVYQNHGYSLTFKPQDIIRSKLFSFREKLQFVAIMTRLVKTDPVDVADMPVAEWIDRQIASPVLRHALLAVVRLATYTNAPEMLSTAVFLNQAQLKGGVRYLDGGWQTLVDGLHQKSESQGAVIMTGEKVTAVTEYPQQVTIHLADGRQIQATAVILAVDPQTAARLLPQNSALRQWADRSIPVRAAILDVALRRLPNPDGNFKSASRA